MLKIYIAGFDVFQNNANEILSDKKEICKELGFEGLSPFDNEIEISGDKQRDAKMIRDSNCEMIRNCDCVIANANPFRGAEPDSGTCFEIGFASCLEKDILLYSEGISIYPYQKDFIENFNRILKEKGLFFNNDCRAEDFNLPMNLMLCCSVKYIGKDFEDCVRWLAKDKVNI